jgi:hypothetical protein
MTLWSLSHIALSEVRTADSGRLRALLLATVGVDMNPRANCTKFRELCGKTWKGISKTLRDRGRSFERGAEIFVL